MAGQDFSREKLLSLSRDGISEELFKLLWAKDELSFSPNLNIPDTVIYKYGQPVTWYFTSTDGRIKRKNKHNLVSSKIEQTFNKHILGYDVIAYFITMSSDIDASRQNDTPTVIEYFDRVSLNSFLYNHKKDANGILQRFIEPKTTHNEVIRAIWSPKLCLLERAENKHELHDKRYGVYERTVVYEGPEYYYTAEPLRGPVLSGQIQKQCEAIVAHIGEVTFGQKQVSRIVLNFKVDSRDKVWFLYSTSIRSMDMLEYNPLSTNGEPIRRSLLNIDSVVTLADNVHLNPKKTYEKIVPKVRRTCLSCAKETIEDVRHAVTYKHVMKHYEHVLLILQSSSSAFHGNQKDGTVIWPPDAEVLQATGNVGFGCINFEDGDDQRPSTSNNGLMSTSAPSTAQSQHRPIHRRGHTLRHKRLQDIQIPPILGYLHPKLTSDTFERCKGDPLFQNKTVMVCDDCYLVYAEFATMMLRMGENLKKLLLPDPRHLDSLTSGSLATGTSSAGFHRPSSADWRAISTAAMSSAQGRDGMGLQGVSRGDMRSRSRRHEREAKERAIGLRSSDARVQPELPSMIRSATESQLNLHNMSIMSQTVPGSPYSPMLGGNLEHGSQSILLSSGTAGNQMGTQHPHQGSMQHSRSALSYDADAVHALIAERERQFFREISLNPQLKDQHPLQHLLTAQKKLKLVDEQSGVLMSKAAQESENIFGTKYGRQSQDKFSKFATYGNEMPYVHHGEVILPSQLKEKTRQQALKAKKEKQEALRRFLDQQQRDEEAQFQQLQKQQQQQQAVQKAALSTMDVAVVSSQQYRDFLKDSLQKIGADMTSAQDSAQTGALRDARRELADTAETQSLGPTSRSHTSQMRSQPRSSSHTTHSTPAAGSKQAHSPSGRHHSPSSNRSNNERSPTQKMANKTAPANPLASQGSLDNSISDINNKTTSSLPQRQPPLQQEKRREATSKNGPASSLPSAGYVKGVVSGSAASKAPSKTEVSKETQEHQTSPSSSSKAKGKTSTSSTSSKTKAVATAAPLLSVVTASDAGTADALFVSVSAHASLTGDDENGDNESGGEGAGGREDSGEAAEDPSLLSPPRGDLLDSPVVPPSFIATSEVDANAETSSTAHENYDLPVTPLVVEENGVQLASEHSHDDREREEAHVSFSERSEEEGGQHSEQVDEACERRSSENHSPANAVVTSKDVAPEPSDSVSFSPTSDSLAMGEEKEAAIQEITSVDHVDQEVSNRDPENDGHAMSLLTLHTQEQSAQAEEAPDA